MPFLAVVLAVVLAAAEPFAFADFSWVPGNAGASERPLSFGPFVGEVRVDSAFHFSFANPADNTISGSSEVFRHGELQLTHLGFGGDFSYRGVHARVMTQFGLYSQTTPRNDASPARGQWNLADAYRYLSEAYGGYHFDALHGINVQAGIFMSYVGLWSYYNFDNWTYQPSYVSSNTPWFFTGVRAHVGNQYFGTDTPGNAMRYRVHTDDSVSAKYFEASGGVFSKGAVSVTLDAGCEFGGGVVCSDQYFLGFMAYHWAWFFSDLLALTVGGGAITNPGRYLVLLPPINGATASSGTPYFTANPGEPFQAWDLQVALDVMPKPYVTLRAEFNHRAASVPYFTGRGGVTPPGGNQGAPGSLVDAWAPDLSPIEDRVTVALMVKL